MASVSWAERVKGPRRALKACDQVRSVEGYWGVGEG